jgi:hypothetical protein
MGELAMHFITVHIGCICMNLYTYLLYESGTEIGPGVTRVPNIFKFFYFIKIKILKNKFYYRLSKLFLKSF